MTTSLEQRYDENDSQSAPPVGLNERFGIITDPTIAEHYPEGDVLFGEHDFDLQVGDERVEGTVYVLGDMRKLNIDYTIDNVAYPAGEVPINLNPGEGQKLKLPVSFNVALERPSRALAQNTECVLMYNGYEYIGWPVIEERLDPDDDSCESVLYHCRGYEVLNDKTGDMESGVADVVFPQDPAIVNQVQFMFRERQELTQ